MSGGGTATLAFAPAQGFAPGEVLRVSLPASLTGVGGTPLSRQVYEFTAATGGTGRGYYGDTTVVGVTSNRDLLLGDVDNDGDLDLVTSGSLFGSRIFLNDGAGRYRLGSGVITAATPSGATLADVDQDGDLDLLVGDADNAAVAVCLNNGAGRYNGSVTGAQNAPVGLRPVDVAAGDVDGDGDLDFVTANSGGASATVLFNAGSGVFGRPATVPMGSGPSAVALADIDNDGDLDLLTTNVGTPASPLGVVNVSRNNGAGVFGAYVGVAVGLQPGALALADLDGDGDLDLLTADGGAGTVSVRPNTGNGGFGSGTALALPAGSTPTAVKTGDVDADGDLDLLVAQGVGGAVLTYLNTGGVFVAQVRPLRLFRPPAAPVPAVGLALGDVDGDLDLDLVTADDQNQVMLSRNLSSPPPLPAPVVASLTPASGQAGTVVNIGGTNLGEVVAVRFNGLLAPGFVLNGTGTGLTVTVPAGASTGPVTVITAEAGMAASANSFFISAPFAVLGTTPGRNALRVPVSSNVTATFGAAITAASAANLRVFGSQRRGSRPGTVGGGGTSALTFDPAQDFAPGERVSVSLPARLTDAAGNPVRPQVTEFVAATGGTGQMNLDSVARFALTEAGEPALGDLDNDGDLDLATVYPSAGIVGLRFNDGSGTLSPRPDLAPTSPMNLKCVGLSDVDADGDLDVVALATNAGVANVWRNNGSGSFGAPASVALGPPRPARRLLLADVDADGDQDLLALTNLHVVVRLNDGAGNFAGGSNTEVTSGPDYFVPSDLVLGDLDNDGDLDLAVSAAYASGGPIRYLVQVQRNDGGGTFVAGPEVACDGPPGRLVLGDLNGDGALDLGVSVLLGTIDRIRLLPNDGTGTFGRGTDLPSFGANAVLGDLDADGDLDFIADGAVCVNDGTGEFRGVVPLSGWFNYPAGLAAGDLDGDGDLDLLVTEATRSVAAVHLNNPAPAPTLAAPLPGSGPVGTVVLLEGTNLLGATALTFNGVPAPGFVVTGPTEIRATVPPGAGTGPVGVTTPAGTAVSAAPFVVTQPIAVLALSPARNAGSAPRATAVAATFGQTISNASAADVRVFGSRGRGLQPGTLAGGGTATLTFRPTRPFAPGEQVSVTLPRTLAGTAGGNARPQVYQFTAAADGPGTGIFRDSTFIPALYSPKTSVAGDLDNDGDADLVSGDGNVYLNDGAGRFANSGQPPLYLNYADALVLGDLDADGLLDLLSSGGDNYLNLGGGAFQRQPSFSTANPGTIRDVAVGDLDGDGDLDFAFPNYFTDSLYLRLNDGTGRAFAKRQLAVGSRPVAVALADLDNDGDLDALVGCFALGGTSSFVGAAFNSGAGVLARPRPLGVGGAERLALGDVDADGDLDLLTSAGAVCANDGSGTFTVRQTTGAAAAYAVALADVDADGDLDLLTTGLRATLRLNDGRGQFGPGGSIRLHDTFYGLSLADVDGDGDLDVLATSQRRNGIELRLNQRIAPPTLLGFSPASGLPGAVVTVTGTDFIGTTGVTFNGTTAPGFVVNSVGQLTVAVPAGASTGPLRVTNPAGAATSAAAFTVLAPVGVVGLSPARNAVVPRTAAVAVTFGAAMATNTPANLAVFSSQRGGRLAGTRTGAGTSRLAFAPAQPYRAGERLSVSIPAYTEANQRRVVKQVYQFEAAVGGTGRGYFSAPRTVPVGVDVGGQAVGDVNGDGSPDVLQHLGTSVLIMANNGIGNFSPAGSVAVPATTGPDLALADFDGDGDLDLAVGNYSTDEVSIRLNDGAGVFSGTLNVPVAPQPQYLAVLDLDADGDLDLVTGGADRTGYCLSRRFNDGTGRFSGTGFERINAITNRGGSDLAVGDVDADGDLDLVANLGNGGAEVLQNDGLGGLALSGSRFAVPNGAFTVKLADVDADGDLDVLGIGVGSIGGLPATLGVGLNNGAGAFSGTSFAVARTSAFTVADADADGDADLLVANELWLNDGQGRFALAPPRANEPVGAAFLCDVDDDGDLDALVPGYRAFLVQLNGPVPPVVVSGFAPGTGSVRTVVAVAGSGFVGATAVRLNGVAVPGFVVVSDTQLTFTVPAGATSGPVAVATAGGVGTSGTAFVVLPAVQPTSLVPGRNAVAGARAAPLGLVFPAAVTTASAGALRVFGNQLQGRRAGTLSGGGTAALAFAPAQAFAPGEVVSVSLPLTMQTTGGGVVSPQVYQFTAATGGTGLGFFRRSSGAPTGGNGRAVALGDLDNDGDLDALLANAANGAGLEVLLNDGRARFSLGTGLNPGSGYLTTDVALADVDADGDLDALASYNGAGLTLCRNNGNATFGPPTFLNIACDRMALGDLDADGDLDLVAASLFGTLTVALNDGTGQWAVQPLALPAPTAGTVALGDVDNDGDLDAVTTNDASGWRLFRNDGTGTLSAAPAPPAIGGRASGLALADLDADGDLDLALTYLDSGPVGWLTTLANDGSGTFAAPGPRTTTGFVAGPVAAGDVDADGDLDLLTLAASVGLTAINVQLNNGRGLFAAPRVVDVRPNSVPLALGDLDGDGDLDFVATQPTSAFTFLDIRLNAQSLSATAAAALAPLTIHPNPAHGRFTVRVPAGQRLASPQLPVQLFNTLGQLVLEQPFVFAAKGEVLVDAALLPPGLYTVRLLLGDGPAVGKIALE